MFKKIQVQLTLLCTLVCGAILVVMSLVCLSVSEKESQNQKFAEFQINVNMLVSYLDSQTVISHAWLSQFRSDTGFEIDIRDNGFQLMFGHTAPNFLEEGVLHSLKPIRLNTRKRRPSIAGTQAYPRLIISCKDII